MFKTTTITKRLSQLIDQIEHHPHKDEILRLAQEQQMDDVSGVVERNEREIGDMY